MPGTIRRSESERPAAASTGSTPAGWMLACALVGVILGGTGAVVAFAVDDNSTVQLPNSPGSSDHPVLPSNFPSLPGLPSGVKLPTIPHSFANRPDRVPTR